jgi:hypothetical protein
MERSAVHRLPAEIWVEILDILLLTLYHFDVDCSLPSLWEWFWELGRPSSEWRYKISEQQRLTFALVCRSWKEYAESRANRSEHIITALPRSRRITIEDVEVEHPCVSTRWEVLVAKLEDEEGRGTEHVRRIAQSIHLHKNIKRIDLRIIGEVKIPDLMHVLPAFDKLVCLSVILDDASCLSLPSEPVSLPNLKSLVLQTPYMLQYPHEMFEIPSLVNLHFTVTEGAPSFEELLKPFHSTLKNLEIRWGSRVPPVTTHTLPGWNLLPHLEELVLDDWESHTPRIPSPLPPTHPLRTVRLDQVTWPIIDQLLPGRDDPNLLERNSIKKISILTLLWGSGVYQDQNGYHIFDQPERARIYALWKQCANMGIRLEDMAGACLEDSGGGPNCFGDLEGLLGNFRGKEGTDGYEFEYSQPSQLEEIVFG